MNVPALLVQYLMKNRAISEMNLKEFVQHANPNGSQLNLTNIMEEVRLKLNNFNLRIDLVRCELTGTKFFVCLFAVERDNLAEYPLLLKKEEECMFAIIDEIMNNNGSPLGSNEAINILMGLDLTEMLRPEKAINILKSFVSMNILKEKQEGYYLLGPLVLASLKHYLSSHSNSKVCALCTKDVVYSKSCHSCDAVMHYYCFKDSQREDHSNKCPLCQH